MITLTDRIANEMHAQRRADLVELNERITATRAQLKALTAARERMLQQVEGQYAKLPAKELIAVADAVIDDAAQLTSSVMNESPADESTADAERFDYDFSGAQ